MKFFRKYRLTVLLILGLILRLSLLFYDYGWDVNNHLTWAKDLHNRGFTGFYATQSSEVYATLFPNYPPLSLFIFYLFYPLQTIAEKIAWQININLPLFPSKLIFFIQNRSFLAAMLKLPAVFADLGIAYLCYLFAKKIIPSNQATNKLITIFILFNPAFFYNSALWGQIDSIPVFFILLSLYSLFYTNKYLLSTFFFVLGILVKPTVLVYLPVYFIFFLNKYKIFKFLKSALFGAIIFYLTFLPFLNALNNPLLPISIFSEKIMAAQSLPYVTNGAFNFWVLIKGFAGLKDTSPFLFGISYRLWGYLITGFFTVFVLLSSLRKQGSRLDTRLRGYDISRYFYATFLIAFAAFLFLTKMHERYSMLLLPFLLLAAFKNRALFKWYVILSLISFLNLYHSWPVPKLGLVTDFLYLPFATWSISFANVFIFLFLLRDFATISHYANNRRSPASL